MRLVVGADTAMEVSKGGPTVSDAVPVMVVVPTTTVAVIVVGP